MTKEIKAGCSRPEITKNQEQVVDETPNAVLKEEKQKMIKV
ncbi:MAG: peroxiredoxin, partial [Clostridiales bacterium]|nr:peroxiredoxin [Clostridiales bacterium]